MREWLREWKPFAWLRSNHWKTDLLLDLRKRVTILEEDLELERNTLKDVQADMSLLHERVTELDPDFGVKQGPPVCKACKARPWSTGEDTWGCRCGIVKWPPLDAEAEEPR